MNPGRGRMTPGWAFQFTRQDAPFASVGKRGVDVPLVRGTRSLLHRSLTLSASRRDDPYSMGEGQGCPGTV